MSSVILELQRDALDKNVKVSDLLRKSLVVARKLSLKDFQDWIDKELQGYENNQDIPYYREMFGQVKAWNPYRGWVPVFFENPREGELLSGRKCGMSIAEIEHLLEDKKQGSILAMPFSHKIQRQLCEGFGMNLEVNLLIQKSNIIRVIDAVRTIILNWALKLEEEGILGEGLSFSQKEKEAAIKSPQNIAYFYGTVLNPQIQQGVVHGIQVSADFDVQLEEIRAFIEKFKGSLATLELTDDQRKEAAAELQKVEAQVKSPRPKPSIIREGLKSLRRILESAGGAIAGQLLGHLPSIFS